MDERNSSIDGSLDIDTAVNEETVGATSSDAIIDNVNTVENTIAEGAKEDLTPSKEDTVPPCDEPLGGVDAEATEEAPGSEEEFLIPTVTEWVEEQPVATEQSEDIRDEVSEDIPDDIPLDIPHDISEQVIPEHPDESISEPSEQVIHDLPDEVIPEPSEQEDAPIDVNEPIPTEGYFPAASGYGDSLSDEAVQPDNEQIHFVIPPVDGEAEPAATDTPPAEEKADSEGAADTETKPKGRFIDALFDFVELAIFTLAAIMILTSFFFRHSIVEGDSMLGTLEDGEHLIISDFMYEPRPGDIVVVEDYSTALKKPIIKRVIATGGQKVRIEADGVTVDGEKLKEEYVYFSVGGYYYDIYPSQALLENETLAIAPGLFYEFVVPEGEIFVMGDHRNNSTDSRHIGTVDEEAVIGRVVLRFLPFDKFGPVTD
ncbi:MAG: signal peptidase I [Clostridia bacterium]|nr:signal peptidase I [Clostridia bacterium]